MLLSWSSFAYSQKISLKLERVSFEKLVQEIERQTPYKFVFDPKEITDQAKFSIQSDGQQIKVILDQAFKNHNLDYQVIGETIVVKGKSTRNKQQQRIQGRVRDENQQAMSNVSIRIKQSNQTFQTDANGDFSFDGPSSGTLVFTFMGYKTQEVAYSGSSQLNISMVPDLGNLDEVVVIGYGTSSVRKNVGSVSSVSAQDLEKQPVLDPLAAMQGRISGLSISSNSGLPGGSYNVQLRGANSINNGNSPLYIVDGVPFSDNAMNQFISASGNQNPLSLINPKDIERIDVLKDADATAIYGSRGANGVILITTKKGSAQELKINASLLVGNSHAIKNLEMMNTEQYLEIRNEAFTNDGTTPDETNAPDLKLWDSGISQDWQKDLFGNSAAFNSMQLSFNGGTSTLQYLLSGSYSKQGDVLPGDRSYQRGGGMLSISNQSKNGKFRINGSANFNADNNNTLATDIAQFYNLAPNYPLYNDDQSFYWFGTSLQNPMAYLVRGNTNKSKSLLANTSLSYLILDGLDAKLNMGYQLQKMDQLQTLPSTGFNPLVGTAASARYGNSDFSSFIIEPQLNYNKQFGNHEIGVLLGGTWQKSLNEGKFFNGTNYPSDSQLDNIHAAGDLSVGDYQYGDYRYQSIFSRISYAYQEKYLVNLSGRRDGSSRFGPNNRYGNFGSIGFAWIFSKENFLRDQSILSFGKLRGSLGITGNDQIGNYQFLDTWEPGFAYQGIAGLSPVRVFNPNFKWEENKKREIALDLGFFNDRLFLTTNYYNNRSGNQLIEIQLAPQTGFEYFFGNQPALVENSGWEFELNSTNFRNSNFTWNTQLNLTFPKNKLLAYPDLENSASAYSYVIGESVRVVKGYDFIGVDPETGLGQYTDVNADDELDEANDFVVLGNLMPKFYGGLNNNLSFKDLSLSFLFQFVKQEGPSIAYGPMASHIGGLSNMDVTVLDRWQKPGDITDIPRATTTASNDAYTNYRDYYRYSSAVWDDASYIRLKTLALSYNLSKWSKQINIPQLQISFAAQNLYTWTNFRGMDPEMQGFDRTYVSEVNPFGSVKTTATPSPRTYTFGLQLTF
ncbi:TonB-dependent receptor [Sphingobacterium kyonggiense]|uniref:TonB-dependent receptor n=2 Tax=Sphingobacterium kyonggiense TaxID=714075 RepID=A0ABP7YMR7_9SPHI